MANPMRKHTPSRRDKRRANWKLTLPTLTRCSQCAQHIIPHRICPHCGYYRGRHMVVIISKEERAKKHEERAAR